MQDVPLTVTRIMQYGTSMCGDAEVVTWQGESGRRASYSSVGERIARLANGLRQLGVDGDDRVGTFMWNNQEHLEAYLAIPSMGAVLHTLNIRLFPEQVVYIANHAEDKVVIVDASLAAAFAKLLPQLSTVRAVVVAGEYDVNVFDSSNVEIVAYDELLAANAPTFDWPDIDERAAAAMCYTSGTTGNPKGVAYSHRSMVLHTMTSMMVDTLAVSERDTILPIVPMFHANAWGFVQSGVMAGANLVLPGSDMTPEHVIDLMESEKVTFAAGVPTIWMGVLPLLEGRDLSCLNRI